MNEPFGFMMPTERTRQLASTIKERSKLNTVIGITKWVKDNIGFEEDITNWKAIEYIPTPDETLDKGKEDCDGQSGLLAATLLSTDMFDTDDIRVVIGRFMAQHLIPAIMVKLIIGSPLNARYHAWVEAKVYDEWYILEPTMGKVYKKEDNKNYIPLINFYARKIELGRV